MAEDGAGDFRADRASDAESADSIGQIAAGADSAGEVEREYAV